MTESDLTKINAEIAKLIAETNRINTELIIINRINTESTTINRICTKSAITNMEMFWYPLAIAATFVVITITLTKLFL